MAKAKTLNEQLFGAAREGELETMKTLIQQRADVNYIKSSLQGSYTPVIVVAAITDKFDAVKLLVENNANINVESEHKGLTGFTNYEGYVREIHYKIQKTSTLMQAVMAERDDIVEFLLNKKALPNYLSSYKKDCDIPLHIATYKGQTKIVKLLLEHKANPHLKDSTGETALEFLRSLIEISEKHHLRKQENASEIEALLLNAMNNFEPEVAFVKTMGQTMNEE